LNDGDPDQSVESESSVHANPIPVAGQDPPPERTLKPLQTIKEGADGDQPVLNSELGCEVTQSDSSTDSEMGSQEPHPDEDWMEEMRRSDAIQETDVVALP
jgi:hypothetical protein